MKNIKGAMGLVAGMLLFIIGMYWALAPRAYSIGSGPTLFLPIVARPLPAEGVFVYGSATDERFMLSQQTADGGLIVVGHTITTTEFYETIQVVKFNSVRAVEWHKELDSEGTNSPEAIKETADGGFILATSDTVNGQLIKLRSDGSIEWQRNYGTSLAGNYLLKDIIQTSDGGYLGVGQFLAGLNQEAWVLKLAANGDIQWEKSYEGAFNDLLGFAMETIDGYLVAGSTSNVGTLPGDMDGWVLKLHPTGDIAWQKSYGGNAEDVIHHLVPTADSNLLAVGNTSSFGDETEGWLLKITADGSIVWQKRYGGTGADQFHQVEPTGDGGYLVVGEFTPDEVISNSDSWVVKLNSDGSIAWQKSYGGSGTDVLTAIYAMPNDTWLATGTTNSIGAGGYDFWTLTLNDDGELAGCPGGVNSNGDVKDTAVAPLTFLFATQSLKFSTAELSLTARDVTGEAAFTCLP